MQVQNDEQDPCVGAETGIQVLGSRSLEELCGVIIEVAGEEIDGEEDGDDDGNEEEDDDDDDDEEDGDGRKEIRDNSITMDVTIWTHNCYNNGESCWRNKRRESNGVEKGC